MFSNAFFTQGLSSNYPNARWSSESDTGDLVKGRYGGKKVVENETQPETNGTVSIPHLPNPIGRSEAVFKMIHCRNEACTQAQFLSLSFSVSLLIPMPDSKKLYFEQHQKCCLETDFLRHIKCNQTNLNKSVDGNEAKPLMS